MSFNNIHQINTGLVYSITNNQVGHPTSNDNEHRAPATDTAEISDTAKKLKTIEESLSKMPVVDPQRTQEAHDKVIKGHYAIDPAKLAEKLLNLASFA